MNLIKWYRVMRFFYCHKMAFVSKIIQAIVFLIYNSKITGDTEIGKGTYFVCRGISTVLIPGTKIGDNCVLGLRFSTIRQFPYKKEPSIGNNVWIGPNVIVAGPVVIEDNVVIVGNSYVTRSVPNGAIVSGNPAKIVGWRKDLKYDINSNPKYLDGIMPFLKERERKCVSLDSNDENSKKVIQIIARCLNVSVSSIDVQMGVGDFEEWDSLMNVTIIDQLEKSFNIQIPKDDLINLTTIKSFIDEVKLCSNKLQVDNQADIEKLNDIDAGLLSYSLILKSIIENAQREPLKKAIIVNENKSISYAELIQNVRKTASFMKTLGLLSGDKIILSGHKDIEFVYVYLASQLLGVVNVIVDSKSNAERLKYIENVVKPKFVFGYKSDIITSILFEDLSYFDKDQYLIESSNLKDSDICEILFTTGTTGEPKGVCLSYANVYGSASNINEYIGNTSDDVEIIGLPICHSFGLGRLRCNLIKGATVVFINGFTNIALFFDYIRRYKVTGFGVVPAAWAYIMKLSGQKILEFSNQIRYIEIGSASMPFNVKKDMLNMFPDTKICMHFGSTEASRSCFIEFHDVEHLNSIGRPVTDKVDVKIFNSDGFEMSNGEKGEICVKGNMVMSGYLNEKQTSNSFFGSYFRTGDCGYKLDDGYFYLLGREKEVINVGGKKVSPLEIEDVICSLGVGDCVCVPMEDKQGILGEVVKCFILKDSTKLSFEQIAEALKGKIEPYKCPVAYDWIEEIPQTSSGKKQRLNL